LRVQDQLDAEFLNFVNTHRDVALQHVELEWSPVSQRAGAFLGKAVLGKGSPASRWSFPLLDTQSAFTLMNSPFLHGSVPSIAASLECLSLRFENSGDMNEKMRQLSPLFRAVFQSASNLVSVHIGFPQASVSIALEDVFHSITLEKLRVFSIGGWRLSAKEIIELARCYRMNLRGLRLHGVLLKEGGMWKDVLAVIRDEMQNLRWLSLSKADYAKSFDERTHGVDMTGDSDLESADETEDEDTDDAMDDEEDDTDQEMHGHDDESSSESGEEAEVDSDIDSVDDINPTAHAFTTQVEHPTYEYTCTCSSPATNLNVEGLGDDGRMVTQSQRKMWERWVVGCLLHNRNDHSPAARQAREGNSHTPIQSNAR
jgi:hypothetical protein